MTQVKAFTADSQGAERTVMRRFARGAIWSLAGDAGARILAFVTAIAVARALGVADYGAYALIQSTVAALAIVAQFGMGSTATRFIAAFRQLEHERIGATVGSSLSIALLTGSSASLAFFVAAPWVARQILHAPDLTNALRIVAPVLCLHALSGTLSGLVLGFEAFSAQARAAWTSATLSLICIIAGTLLGGMFGAVIGMIVAETFRVGQLMALTIRMLHESGSKISLPRRIELRSLAGFGWPVLLTSVLHAPVLWLCQSMIARGADGIFQVGLYDAALKWLTVVTLVPFGLTAAVAPILANLRPNDHAVHCRATRHLVGAQAVLTVVPAVTVACSAPWLVRIFGDDFSDAVPVIRLLMVVAPVFVMKHFYWQVLTSLGRAWAAASISALWAIVAVLTTWILRDAGAIGLAWAMFTSYGAALLASILVGAFSTPAGRPISEPERVGDAV